MPDLKVSCMAMFDSGNTFHSVISEDLFNKLRMTAADLADSPQPRSVATASKTDSLEVLGRLRRPLTFHLSTSPVFFRERFYVLKNLNMDMNLSKTFMQRHSIDELHSQNAVRIKKQILPLLSKDSQDWSCYAVKRKVIPAKMVAQITVEAPHLRGQPDGVADFYPSLVAMLERGLQPPQHVTPAKTCQSQVNIAVMNTTDRPVTIDKHAKLGLLAPITLPEEEIPPRNVPPWTTEIEGKAFIRKKFQLDTKKSLPNEQLRQKATDLLYEFADVFAWQNIPGRTTSIVHKIPLLPHSTPVAVPTRPINPPLRKQLQQQVQEWLRLKVIRPSTSPWRAPTVVVPKKRIPGQPPKHRVCIDYR